MIQFTHKLKTKMTTRARGQYFENLALKYLKSSGLRLIERNYACKAGEIDLICSDQETMVFIEVRFRKNESYGSGTQTVQKGKQEKIINTAKLFLVNKGLYDKIDCRFDVLGISLEKGEPTYQWIKNAFP